MKKRSILLLSLLLVSCNINSTSNISSLISIDVSSSISSESLNSSSLINISENSSQIDIFAKKKDYLRSVFGTDILYSSDDVNPYNINIRDYGRNIDVIFYEPNLTNDPYASINKEDFYNNYQEASTYEEAYFRSKNHLMSGDITPQGHIPEAKVYTYNDYDVRCSSGTYVLDKNGDYIAYIMNDFNDEYKAIFYGGAYTSLNDVSCYLFAFGEVPVNSNYSKSSSGRKKSVQEWGEYGRVNIGGYSNDVSSYPFEPELPTNVTYTETDFGTIGGYTNENPITGTSYTQDVYNDGTSISRGAARFVFCSDPSIKNIDQRYVFYTYNHYNDFQEYLNYKDGFGKRFGNQSAGNYYCGNKSDYYDSNQYPLTIYQEPLFLTHQEIVKL